MFSFGPGVDRRRVSGAGANIALERRCGTTGDTGTDRSATTNLTHVDTGSRFVVRPSLANIPRSLRTPTFRTGPPR